MSSPLRIAFWNIRLTYALIEIGDPRGTAEGLHAASFPDPARDPDRT